MSFGEKILKYKEDIIADLTELIAIQSISGVQEDTSRALDWMLKKAESFGLETKSYDGVAGHVQLGNGGQALGDLLFADVVQTGAEMDLCLVVALESGLQNGAERLTVYLPALAERKLCAFRINGKLRHNSAPRSFIYIIAFFC